MSYPKPKRKTLPNELFALHLDGQMLHPAVWANYSERYGKVGEWIQGWRPPKKVYHSIGHARVGIGQLPAELRGKVEIVRYTPAEVVQKAKSMSDRDLQLEFESHNSRPPEDAPWSFQYEWEKQRKAYIAEQRKLGR